MNHDHEDDHFYIQQYQEVLHVLAFPDTVVIEIHNPEGAQLSLTEAKSLQEQLGMAIARAESLAWFENADGFMEVKEKDQK